MIRGGCLCGAVGFRVDGPVHRMAHCHCSMCGKHHGAAFGTYVNAWAEDVASQAPWYEVPDDGLARRED